jgi:formate dehydrogenase major subunit
VKLGGVETTTPLVAASLDDPSCAFARMARHYARYTPEMVERVLRHAEGQVPRRGQDLLHHRRPGARRHHPLRHGPDAATPSARRTCAPWPSCSSSSATSASRAAGVNALRGESNVQGSTDMALLFHDLPGYLGCPSEAQDSFATYGKKFDTHELLVERTQVLQLPHEGLVRRRRQGGERLGLRLPAQDRRQLLLDPAFEALHAGKLKGMFAMGQNPAVSGPNARFERKALGNLDWLVVMELFETETAGFWHAPGVDPSSIKTEVFLLPASDAMEKPGSIVTLGPPHPVRDKVAASVGEAKEDIWILDRLAASSRRRTPAAPRRRTVRSWISPGTTAPARGGAHRARDQRLRVVEAKDATGKVLVEAGKTVPGIAALRRRAGRLPRLRQLDLQRLLPPPPTTAPAR